MQLVGSIEAKSTHPISKAFTEYLEKNKLERLEVSNFESVAGHGLKGKIEDKEIFVGNAKLLAQYNIENSHEEDETKLKNKGNSIVYIAIDKKVVAIIGVNDIVRDNAKEIIQKLKEKNVEPIMLTGDNKETANIIANEIGITNVIADVLPVDKANVIKKLKKENRHVMMCGDGINDSPALANADIGVSVHSGTDIAMDSSDVILMKDDLNKIVDLINISKKTIRNIKQNLFWAFFYNVLMIPVAMGIFRGFGIVINPMIAGVAMMFSSLTVIGNSLRIRRNEVGK